ncbi:MAG TPA: septal ring lytic transglycosylase RlpA family protein [Steroidobacteraceae bacterium]|nr:septal ring lytic transglycosylase RlpA family protein [Steroidobacteraceae bacterium]
MSTGRLVLACCALLSLIACGSAPQRPIPAPTPLPTPSTQPPASMDVSSIPDAVPRAEPKSAKGNPAFYNVLGKRYFVLPTANGYVERGVASWYGPGFHAKSTSNGERYDMYAMSAAHTTLPLPAYVKVTNLKNGRSVTVRVNDRGPFKDGRIIDLSYTAASKLGMLRDGTAFVEVRHMPPNAESNEAVTPPTGALFVQAGAFGTEANAAKLVAQLKAQGVTNAAVRADQVNGQTIHRVRVGPVPTVPEFDRAVARLKKLGVADARLAAD